MINDDWLFVRYLNNEVKQISVRQAFIDADKIKNIETPIFHNTRVYIYDVPVIQLLSTILLATYFKPEVNFKAHSSYFSKDLMKNGWDLDLILSYLDQYQHKFNMFDDTYPFLQNIKLKQQKTKDEDNISLGYISKTNLVAPGGNNLIFEHNSSTKTDLCSYKPTEDELVYILLYLRTMATSPMSKYYPNKALCGNTTMFMINYGKNLKETIVFSV